jgi:hypothetical protein
MDVAKWRNRATAIALGVLIAGLALVMGVAVASAPERKAEACSQRWAPLTTEWHYRSGCSVYINDHWTPEGNIVVVVNR